MGAFKGRRLDIKIVNSEHDSREDIGLTESDLCFKAFLVLAHHGLDKRQMQFQKEGPPNFKQVENCDCQI